MSKLNELVTNIAFAAFILMVGYFWGDHRASRKFEIERDAINNQASAKYNKLVADTNKEQSDSKTRIAELNTKVEGIEKNAKITIDKLRDDVRNRSIRVSVPIASCTASPIAGGATVTPDNGQARAELLPETVLDLISIAADANSEVRRTNQCIDQYNEMKSMVDKLRNNKVE